MANQRGVVTFTLKGTPLTLTPSFDALLAIEDRVGPVTYVHQAHLNARLSLTDIATIFVIGLSATQDMKADENIDRMKKWVFEAGVASELIRENLSEFLLQLQYTPDELAKKRQAEQEERDALFGQMGVLAT